MMASSVIFPYFYFSNETLLRQLYLYMPPVVRVHPCDRPPRDNKQVKRLVSDLMRVGFLENHSQNEFDAEINERFLRVVERGFQENRPLYLKHLGKYEKERASAKTFHLCRKKLWEDLVQRLLDLGIATVDNYDEWCFSTRMMVMVMTTCAALSLQRRNNLPRSTDLPEYDELACLIEGLPQDDGHDVVLRRAILEFPYVVPKYLPAMQLDRLMNLRDALKPITKQYQSILQEEASDLQQSTSLTELEERVKCIGERVQEIFSEVEGKLKSHNEALQTMYAQYRWHLPPGSPAAGLVLEEPIVKKDVTFAAIDSPASPSEIDAVMTYPGSFVWAQEAPKLLPKPNGFWKRLFSFGQS
ncbi:MAG: hypothetical protein JXR73_06995 [Candidatus Omnitrophica bacterium]|nr:hypothetical protein [Candidatus Omnitrophota bacterium]